MTLLIYLTLLEAIGKFNFIWVAFGVVVWTGHILWNAMK